MALQQEDVTVLTGLFPLEQHEFNPRGFVYVSEQAICARLEAVDPSWHWDIKSVQVRDNVAVVVGTLTIKGVTREGVGMDKIQENAGEAEKSAATDALKRAARLFGVGRYLLDNPKEGDFKKWLAAEMGRANKEQKPRPTEPPADNEPLSPDAVRSLVLEGKRNGMTDAQVLAALGCTAKWSEYTGTMSQARVIVRKAADALKAANGAAMPDDAFGGAK
jgi:hypothetical protein